MSDTATTNVAVGDIFIIPNSMFTLGKLSPSSRERIKRDLGRLNINGFRGADVAGDEPLVQVWASSPECDNWSAHDWDGYPFYGGASNQYAGLTACWPVRALKDLKDGDKFVAYLTTPTGAEWKLVLTAKQEGYRYRSHGSFEKVLRDLLERFRGRELQPWPA